MSNIDQTKIETAEQKSAELLEQRIHLVKSECRRRIYAQASATTQTNIIAASSAGLLTEAQKTVLVATLGWVRPSAKPVRR